MSYQFNVVNISVTTSPATTLGHDGQPYTRDDAPVGTILAIDSAGHMFAYVGPVTDPKDWVGGVTTKPRKLFRDYWRWVASPHQLVVDPGRLSPHDRALILADREVLWAVTGAKK